MDKAKDIAGDLAAKAGDLVDKADEKLPGSVKEKAGDLVDKVDEKIPGSVKDKAGELAGKAGELIAKAKDKLGLVDAPAGTDVPDATGDRADDSETPAAPPT
jgi:hypothetical protein